MASFSVRCGLACGGPLLALPCLALGGHRPLEIKTILHVHPFFPSFRPSFLICPRRAACSWGSAAAFLPSFFSLSSFVPLCLLSFFHLSVRRVCTRPSLPLVPPPVPRGGADTPTARFKGPRVQTTPTAGKAGQRAGCNRRYIRKYAYMQPRPTLLTQWGPVLLFDVVSYIWRGANIRREGGDGVGRDLLRCLTTPQSPPPHAYQDMHTAS